MNIVNFYEKRLNTQPETRNAIRDMQELEKETVWLTQKQLAGLFSTERSVITKHLNNIFQTGELDKKSNVQKMHIPCPYVPFWNTLISAYCSK